MKSHSCKEVALTSEQTRKMEIANVAFMQECPFYAHLAYSLAQYVFTNDVQTAATDGRHVFLNPEYVAGLKVGEQVAAFAHEMSHLVSRHPQRFMHYRSVNDIKGLPFDHKLANIAADYVINADIAATVPRASINPDWLFDPSISGDELWEDVYVRLFQQQQQQGSGPGGGTKRRKDGPGAIKGQKGDDRADANDGRFDEVLDPARDPATGAEDLPDESEFEEAVARAAAAAKAMGKLPGSLERRIKEILDPQVDWRDHIRMLITARIGQDKYTWKKSHRRRLVFDPIVIMPGKTGYGADTVVVGIDTSGSIGARELDAFLAEVKGVLADCRPRRVIVIGCDARVSQVDELTSMDEFEGLVEKGVAGGGGTDFRPVFQKVADENWRPDTLLYLTDGYGSFGEAPTYPVVWAMTTNVNAPWGEVVRIKI